MPTHSETTYMDRLFSSEKKTTEFQCAKVSISKLWSASSSSNSSNKVQGEPVTAVDLYSINSATYQSDTASALSSAIGTTSVENYETFFPTQYIETLETEFDQVGQRTELFPYASHDETPSI